MAKMQSGAFWKYVPNCITSLRIIGGCALLFLPPLSPWFYGIYTLCGISDVADGCIARATHSTSRLGTILDSIADLLLYATVLLRLLPMLWQRIPMWVWGLFAMVLLIRLGAYTTAAVKYRRFASQHTYLNKLTGFLFFLLPYMCYLNCLVSYCVVGCAVGGLASAEELIIYLQEPVYRPGRQSIFQK